jgi:hypothetical protein
MTWGRKTGGRKKSNIKKPPALMAEAQAEVAAAVSANEGPQPLDYMLAVMRDPTARLAQAARPGNLLNRQKVDGGLDPNRGKMAAGKNWRPSQGHTQPKGRRNASRNGYCQSGRIENGMGPKDRWPQKGHTQQKGIGARGPSRGDGCRRRRRGNPNRLHERPDGRASPTGCHGQSRIRSCRRLRTST